MKTIAPSSFAMNKFIQINIQLSDEFKSFQVYYQGDRKLFEKSLDDIIIEAKKIIISKK